MKSNLLRSCALCLFLSLAVITAHAQFTKGNLVVLRVGTDTNTALNSSAAAIFLDQITPAGALVNSFAIPTTGATRLTISGSSTSEGQITRTADGKRIIIAGYDTAVGKASVSSTPGTSVPRAINAITAAAVVSRGDTSQVFQSRNNFRSAAANGNDYWGAGGTSGTPYYGTDTARVIQSSVGNTRVINVYNGSLYFSTASTSGSGVGIYKVGTGLPKTSGQVITPVVLTGSTSSPYAFVFDTSGTKLYVADDRVTSGGGIRKYIKSGASFTLAYTFKVGTSLGARGVCVDFSGAYPVIYATTTNNKVVKITDSGAIAPAIVIYSALKNQGLRGIQFTPVAGCTKPARPTVINGPSRGVCNGDFIYNITPVNGAKRYQWTIPSGTTIVYDSGTSIKIHVTSSFKKDSITVSAVNSCGTSVGRSLVLLSAAPKPIISGPNCVTANQSGLLYSVTNPLPNQTYKWTVTNAKIRSGQNTPNISVTWKTTAGKVTVKAISSCGDTILAVPIQVAVGNCFGRTIDPLKVSESAISVYPNPVSATAHFLLNRNNPAGYSITISDLSGRIVAVRQGTVQAGTNLISVNVSHLNRGLYIATVRISEDQAVLKLIKQ